MCLTWKLSILIHNFDLLIYNAFHLHLDEIGVPKKNRICLYFLFIFFSY